MKYKYLLFDADNTLLDFNISEENSIKKVLARYNIDTKYHSTFSQINNSLWKDLEKGLVSRKDLRRIRFERLLKAVSRDDLDPSQLDTEYFNEIALQANPYEDSYQTLEKCTQMGYKCYIVTNGSTKTQKSRLEISRLSKFIEASFISEEIGLAKPNKSFFDYVLNDIGAEDKQCLIIGDSLTSDILGGINSGIDTCLLIRQGAIDTSSITPTYTIYKLSELISLLGE